MKAAVSRATRGPPGRRTTTTASFFADQIQIERTKAEGRARSLTSQYFVFGNVKNKALDIGKAQATYRELHVVQKGQLKRQQVLAKAIIATTVQQVQCLKDQVTVLETILMAFAAADVTTDPPAFFNALAMSWAMVNKAPTKLAEVLQALVASPPTSPRSRRAGSLRTPAPAQPATPRTRFPSGPGWRPPSSPWARARAARATPRARPPRPGGAARATWARRLA